MKRVPPPSVTHCTPHEPRGEPVGNIFVRPPDRPCPPPWFLRCWLSPAVPSGDKPLVHVLDEHGKMGWQ